MSSGKSSETKITNWWIEALPGDKKGQTNQKQYVDHLRMWAGYLIMHGEEVALQ